MSLSKPKSRMSPFLSSLALGPVAMADLPVSNCQLRRANGAKWPRGEEHGHAKSSPLWPLASPLLPTVDSLLQRETGSPIRIRIRANLAFNVSRLTRQVNRIILATERVFGVRCVQLWGFEAYHEMLDCSDLRLAGVGWQRCSAGRPWLILPYSTREAVGNLPKLLPDCLRHLRWHPRHWRRTLKTLTTPSPLRKAAGGPTLNLASMPCGLPSLRR